MAAHRWTLLARAAGVAIGFGIAYLSDTQSPDDGAIMLAYLLAAYMIGVLCASPKTK